MCNEISIRDFTGLFIALPVVVASRNSSGHHESDEAFDARWEAYFQRYSLVVLKVTVDKYFK